MKLSSKQRCFLALNTSFDGLKAHFKEIVVARAHRHHIPGQVWHITHRCHKREFLLKFSKDRSRWIQWLFEAKQRYKLQILDFVVTSNHIHLLIDLCGCSSVAQFRSTHKQLVDDSIQSGDKERQPDWSEAVAVGGQQFIVDIDNQLNRGSFGRKTLERNDSFILREASAAYNSHLPAKKVLLSAKNSYYLPINCG